MIGRMASGLTKLANAGHRLAVGGLISLTLFMGYTSINQGRVLTERRHRLNDEYKKMQEQTEKMLEVEPEKQSE